MKHKKFYIAVKAFSLALPFLVFSFFSSAEAYRQEESSASGPSASALEPRFEFDPVVEGAEIEHEFLIENRGGSVLHILKVITGCGCTTADYSKNIQPFSTGRVWVKADTEGYGGSTFHQNIEVYTSDPLNEKLLLELIGSVKKFAEISPRRLMIKGSVTDELVSQVRVVPASDFDFKIESADAVDLENSVEVSVNRDKEGFMVTVKNQQKQPGIYVGKIILHTDNVSKPEIAIPLMMGLKP